MLRPIIYGQAPGRTEGPVLGGRIGERLADLLCLSGYPELAERFDLRNLIDYYPGGREERGDLFPMKEAADRARAEASSWKSGQEVILLGRFVQQAFLSVGEPLAFTQRPLETGGRVTIIHLPHPSGANGWWNDPENAARARRFLALALLEPVR